MSQYNILSALSAAEVLTPTEKQVNETIKLHMQAWDSDRHCPNILPAAFWLDVDPVVKRLWCEANAVYGIPTTELIEWLSKEVAMHGAGKCLEIGSAHGGIARALGIKGVDNHMQDWPSVKQHYQQMGSPTIKYGPDVQQIDATLAVERFKPSFVFGAWITHRFNPKKRELGGNQYGPDLGKIIKMTNLCLMGVDKTHGQNPLLQLPHITIKEPWIISRNMDSQNWLKIWGKQ